MDINAGQFLHIEGYLSSKEFLTEDDKRRFQFEVAAMKTWITKPTYRDINLVEINGRCVTDISNTIDFSAFRVLTTIKLR